MSCSSSTSADDSESEEKDDDVKEMYILWDMIRMKRDSKRKKRNKTSTLLTNLRRITSSKTKEHRMSLKERLQKCLKEYKLREDIISILGKDYFNKNEKKEEKELCDYDLEFNEDGTKLKVKDVEDVIRERRNRIKMKKKKLNIILRNLLNKRNNKGIDKNGNVLNSFLCKHDTASNLFQPKTQPILDIDHIVEKCTNQFKASIKSAIEVYAKSIIEPEPVDKQAISDHISEDIESALTKDERPSSNQIPNSENILPPETKSSDIQESDCMKTCLDKETHNNLNRAEDVQSTGREDEIVKETEEVVDGNDEKLETLIVKRQRNVESGRRIFENAYRFFEHGKADAKNETKRIRQVDTGFNDNVTKKRRKNKRNVDSQKEKSNTEEIGIFVNAEMVHPIDIYLSTLPEYSEYRAEVHVPKSCIEDDPSIQNDSKQKDSATSNPNHDEVTTAEEPQSSHLEGKEKDDHISDDGITKETENGNEKSNEPNASVITHYPSSEQSKEDNKKNNKDRSYQKLEKDRVDCQRRIDRELEFFRKLELVEEHSVSSSSEFIEKVLESKERFAKVNRMSEERKRDEAKRSLSPIIVYHYYRPVPIHNEAIFDTDDNSILTPEDQSPINSNASRPRRGPRTPEPVLSDGEIDEEFEERKSNEDTTESLHSEYNYPVVFNQMQNEEPRVDPRLENVKSQTSFGK